MARARHRRDVPSLTAPFAFVALAAALLTPRPSAWMPPLLTVAGAAFGAGLTKWVRQLGAISFLGALFIATCVVYAIALFFARGASLASVGLWPIVEPPLLYPPLVFVVYWAQRVGRARAGSLVDVSDRRMLWIPVASALAVLSAIRIAWDHAPIGWGGVITAMLLMSYLVGRDVCTFFQIRHAARASCAFDLGIGDTLRAIESGGTDPYRSCQTTVGFIAGDIDRCAQLMCVRISGSVVWIACLSAALAIDLRHPFGVTNWIAELFFGTLS